jgi:hypothetical protein
MIVTQGCMKRASSIRVRAKVFYLEASHLHFKVEVQHVIIGSCDCALNFRLQSFSRCRSRLGRRHSSHHRMDTCSDIVLSFKRSM